MSVAVLLANKYWLALAAVLLAIKYWSQKNRKLNGNWDYESLKRKLEHVQLPAMVVDMETLNHNIDEVVRTARGTGHTVRIATKSVRVPALIRHILDRGSPVVKGLMCYSVPEAEFLFTEFRFDDLLIAYPVVQEDEIRIACEMTNNGASIHLMVDSVEHVKLIDDLITQNGYLNKPKKLKLCIDVDVSYRPFGRLHFGVLRSPCASVESFKLIFHAINSSKNLKFASVMAYEALLSAPDRRPSDPLMNLVLPILKKLSWPDVKRRRKEIASFLKGTEVEFFNGGGTATMLRTVCSIMAKLNFQREDSACNEIAVGSGFLQSQVFDYHISRVNTTCAFLFALRVTRIPSDGVVTCQSGGFVSSGPASKLSEPSVFLPIGLTLNPNEGCGEVQTPLYTHGLKMSINDPVFFRPAKAGEIAENFNNYILIWPDSEKTEKTYRGYNKRFF